MQNPVYDLIMGNIEGARLPGEPDPNWQLVQAVETRAQKKEEAKSYRKLKVPEHLQIECTPEEMKKAQQEDSSLKNVREMIQSGDEKISKGGKSVFVTKKGLIYRKFKSNSQDQSSQLVVPNA